MTFAFTPPDPNAGNAPANGAPPAGASTPNSPVPVDAKSALAGFGGAGIDVRDPALPLACSVITKVISTEGKTGRNTGFGLYTRVEITRVGAAGGGECPLPLIKNYNAIPAAVGGRHVIPIRGFDKEDSRNFAFSDLKQLLIAMMESKGLTMENSSAVTPEQWDEMGQAMSDGKLGLEGVEFGVQTSKVDSKGGFGKLKHAFYPLSAVQPAG